jgi:hypothetical protein
MTAIVGYYTFIALPRNCVPRPEEWHEAAEDASLDRKRARGSRELFRQEIGI